MVEFAIESLASARASEGSDRLLARQWQETGDRERPDEALRALESSPSACSAATSAALPASVIRYIRGDSVVIWT